MRILRGSSAPSDSPIALTIGNFDGVHVGHQAMLERLRDAARGAGLPACAMTFEPHPREFFSPDRAPPRLTSMRQKLELLEAHGIARAYVYRFDYRFAQIPAEEFIKNVLVRDLRVRHLLVGDDFRFGARRAGDFAVLRQHAAALGYSVEAMSSVLLGGERVSSTAVREALASGDLARAARLLGRPYGISGRVARGDGLGRKLGYPTANVRVALAPLTGIFAVEVAGAGERVLRGVASLGVRPTVKLNAAPLLEVYLLDFEGDLYGRRLRIDFLHKFRDEEKFTDLAALTRQIAHDVAAARQFFESRDAALQGPGALGAAGSR